MKLATLTFALTLLLVRSAYTQNAPSSPEAEAPSPLSPARLIVPLCDDGVRPTPPVRRGYVLSGVRSGDYSAAFYGDSTGMFLLEIAMKVGESGRIAFSVPPATLSFVWNGMPLAKGMAVDTATPCNQSTGGLIGHVTAEDGTPLEGATVEVLGTNRGANCKAQGDFLIAGLRPGAYSVAISYVALVSDTLQVEIRACNSVEVDVVLEETPTYCLCHLRDTFKPNADKTGSIRTISRDDLLMSGAASIY